MYKRQVLDGVDITSVTSAPIYIRSADKVFITTTSSSENTLTNGGEYDAIDENHIDAVIFSKSDLTLNGAGILKIRAAAGHGIVSKDDLVMTSGTYDIVAQSHGISGKDSVRIANGAYVIEAGKDGIHAENNDDADLGFLYIADGTFQIEADGDGMSAATYLQIDDGFYEIETGGGSLEASEKEEVREFGPGQANHQEETTEQDTVSTKGLKGSKDLTILGGDFVIDSLDDSLHSNGSLSIQGGILELSTGDDGIHADEQVSILDGEIQINNSYEGIEGLCIDIEGGDITLTASDDGLNAAGGNDESGFMGPGGDIFAETEGAYIHISGGTIQIDVCLLYTSRCV